MKAKQVTPLEEVQHPSNPLLSTYYAVLYWGVHCSQNFEFMQYCTGESALGIIKYR